MWGRVNVRCIVLAEQIFAKLSNWRIQKMKPTCTVLRNFDTFQAKTGLPYRFGLTQESVGAKALSMHVISIPPGDRALAHKHEGHESMLFVVSGEAETFYGERLENRVRLRAG